MQYRKKGINMAERKTVSRECIQKDVFMIMCHKNSSQVLRLAKICITEHSDVIVHADSEMSHEDFALLDEFAKNNSQFFLTNSRLHGELDKESLVHIVMEMVRTAKQCQQKNSCHYRYFCLLSGQDYLIKPHTYITDELSKNYPKPFINCSLYDKNRWMYKKFRWNTFTNKIRLKIDEKFCNKRNPIRITLMVLLLFLTKIMHFVLPSIYHQIKKQGAEVYCGSAWWILPDVAIDYIYDEYKKETRLVRLILQSITPEESFFQIMVMCSPVKDLIDVNTKERIDPNCKTWSYFSDDDKPPSSHPYIFTVNEFHKLVKSDKWIARKFDDSVDEIILDMLDDYYKHVTANNRK